MEEQQPEILVYLNDAARFVPWAVDCYLAFRGALGLQVHQAVARVPPDAEPGRLPLVPVPIIEYDFKDILRGRPWEFVEGERYQTLCWEPSTEPEALAEDAAPWERPDDWWKGSG